MRDTLSTPRKRNIVVALVTIGLIAGLLPVAMASDGFSDVPDSNTFHDDISWLSGADVTRGCNPPANTRFCPNDFVTRGQMAAFLRRLANNQVVDAATLGGMTAAEIIAAAEPGGPEPIEPGPIDAADIEGRLHLEAAVPDPHDAVISGVNTHAGGLGSWIGLYGEVQGGGGCCHYVPGYPHQPAGVFGRAEASYGVIGTSGDVTGLAAPIGSLGVVGIGQNRGVYGSSGTGSGVYAVSSSNYGVWGQSATWRGVTGRTGNANNNYGFYTPDNLFALNVQMAGSTMIVVQNGGDEALQVGDVVEFSGVSEPANAGGAPLAQVRQAGTAGGHGVAGVVSSRFNIDAIADDDPDFAGPPPDIDVTPAGPVAPGDHLLLVVMGIAQVRVDGAETSVSPGDTLGVAVTPGLATSDQSLIQQGTPVHRLGVVGTALEPVANGQQGLIWVFVGSR